MTNTRKIALAALSIATLAGMSACASAGASADGGLNCRTITQIMPYSPGGGSDQAARRLQAGVEEILGAKVNIDYRTGGDGSVGWNALATAAPDGCTIANVTSPNMQILTEMSDDVGFEAMDFEYVAYTEYSPFILAVAEDGPYETIGDFVAAAKANPGKLTIAGNGSQGEISALEMQESFDIDLEYVPVSGGTGDIIPRVAGGHIDATTTAVSAVQSGQLKALALSSPFDGMEDVPTFDEAGGTPVSLSTTWGVMLPPGTPQEIVDTWNETLVAAQEMAVKDYEEAYVMPLTQTPEEAAEMARETLDRVVEIMN